MERPTKFYPSAPKLEHFLMKPTNLKALTESATGTDNAGHSSRTEYAPLDAHQYSDYLAAHRSWLSEIEATDTRLHAQSLRKRALKGWRETLVVDAESPDDRTRDPIVIPGYQAEVLVTLEKKWPIPPLSPRNHTGQRSEPTERRFATRPRRLQPTHSRRRLTSSWPRQVFRFSRNA